MFFRDLSEMTSYVKRLFQEVEYDSANHFC